MMTTRENFYDSDNQRPPKKRRLDAPTRIQISAALFSKLDAYRTSNQFLSIHEAIEALLAQEKYNSARSTPGGEPDNTFPADLPAPSLEVSDFVFVQRSKLSELLSHVYCIACNPPCPFNQRIVDKKDHLIVADLVCTNGHEFKWYNSDLHQQSSAFKINTAIPAAFLLCGIGFARYKEISKLLCCGHISKSKFYGPIQKQRVKPVVHSYYESEQKRIIAGLKSKPIKLVFDARYDSPQRKSKQGFWCSMAFMDYATEQIIDVVHTARPRSETKSASREVHSFQIFTEKFEKQLNIEEYIHDADPGVSGAVDKFKKNSQYDWRAEGPKANDLKRAFTPLTKAYKDLRDKLIRIPKHWLKCLKSSHDHPMLFLARLFNCVSHWSGNHKHCKELWPKSKCVKDDYKPKFHLITDQKAKASLFFFLGQQIMDLDLDKYVRGSFTSRVECFNHMLLKYCPKDIFYNISYPMRIELAVLDWNENVDHREDKTTIFKQRIFKKIILD